MGFLSGVGNFVSGIVNTGVGAVTNVIGAVGNVVKGVSNSAAGVTLAAGFSGANPAAVQAATLGTGAAGVNAGVNGQSNFFSNLFNFKNPDGSWNTGKIVAFVIPGGLVLYWVLKKLKIIR